MKRNRLYDEVAALVALSTIYELTKTGVARDLLLNQWTTLRHIAGQFGQLGSEMIATCDRAIAAMSKETPELKRIRQAVKRMLALQRAIEAMSERLNKRKKAA